MNLNLEEITLLFKKIELNNSNIVKNFLLLCFGFSQKSILSN